MKPLLPLIVALLVSSAIPAQHDPILNQFELQRIMRENNTIQFLGINLMRTYLMELDGDAITGRRALISEVYYTPQGNPDYTLYYDSIGKRDRYTLFRYNDNNIKTEEIYFTRDSLLRGGFAVESNSKGITQKQYYYNNRGEFVARQEYKYDSVNNQVIAQIYNHSNQLTMKRHYVFDADGNNEIVKYVYTRSAEGDLIDSISLSYGTGGLVEEKRFYDANGVMIQKLEYVYNESGAVLKSIENNRVTRHIRELSFTYDEFENMEGMLESIDGKPMSYLRFEYYTRVDENSGKQ